MVNRVAELSSGYILHDVTSWNLRRKNSLVIIFSVQACTTLFLCTYLPSTTCDWSPCESALFWEVQEQSIATGTVADVWTLTFINIVRSLCHTTMMLCFKFVLYDPKIHVYSHCSSFLESTDTRTQRDLLLKPSHNPSCFIYHEPRWMTFASQV